MLKPAVAFAADKSRTFSNVSRSAIWSRSISISNFSSMTLTSVMAATESHAATVSCDAAEMSFSCKSGKTIWKHSQPFWSGVIHELLPLLNSRTS